MPMGLGIPVGVNGKGGGRVVSGDANNDKIIRISLGDDDNENAFQQNIGLGSNMIFGISDQQLQSKVERRLFEVFKRFEAQKRFILRGNTIKWTSNPSEQELILEFRYVDIESEQEKQFRANFAQSTSTPSGVNS